MSKTITSEELQQIQKIIQQKQQTLLEIGAHESELHKLKEHVSKIEEQKAALIGDLYTIETQEKEVTTSLHTKYGDGNLDIETGTIS